ncbi:hypothetical protein V2J09_005775 [Rumex salicifolius]
MEDASATQFPLSIGLKLRLDQGVLLKDGKQYRRLFGRLSYLSLTRPDFSYAVQHLSQFGSMQKGLFYPIQQSLKVVGTIFGVMENEKASNCKKRLEYRRMVATTTEIVWISYLLKDPQVEVSLPIIMFCDNKVAQRIATNPCYHERTKH